MRIRDRLAVLIAVTLIGCSGGSKPTMPVAASTKYPTNAEMLLESIGSSSPPLNVAELPPPGESAAEGTASDPISVLPGGDPAALYNNAFGLLRSGDWAGAQAAFEEFIHQYPQEALTSNARYWLGETYFVRGDNDRAAIAFADAYSADPNGARAPYALAKLSLALERAGRIDEACRIVEPLRRAYPLDANRSGGGGARCR